jgi:hypothetical protein
MVDSVVVIPEKAGALTVGIVIILEFPWGNDILCPAVPRGTLEITIVSHHLTLESIRGE